MNKLSTVFIFIVSIALPCIGAALVALASNTLLVCAFRPDTEIRGLSFIYRNWEVLQLGGFVAVVGFGVLANYKEAVALWIVLQLILSLLIIQGLMVDSAVREFSVSINGQAVPRGSVPSPLESESSGSQE
tara:strand:+ start:543 stop:935 length:393 start_codon:yes stop_codon:yes gene_type:complete